MRSGREPAPGTRTRTSRALAGSGLARRLECARVGCGIECRVGPCGRCGVHDGASILGPRRGVSPRVPSAFRGSRTSVTHGRRTTHVPISRHGGAGWKSDSRTRCCAMPTASCSRRTAPAIVRCDAYQAWRERSETVLTGFAPEQLELRTDSIAPPSGRLELVHAGSSLLDRKGATFERCLGALRVWAESDPSVRSTVRVRFVGIEAEAADRIQRLGLAEWVRAEPAVSREALGELLRGAHASLYLAPEGSAGGDPIPGKLFDAVGAARPLCRSRPGDALATLVRDQGLGWVVDPESSESLIACLEDLRRRVRSGPAAFRPQGRGPCVALRSGDHAAPRLDARACGGVGAGG